MNRSYVMSCCVAVAIVVLFQSSGYGFTIEVIPSVAPKGPGGSFAGYSANAQEALENGLDAIGDPATQPTAYQSAEAINVGEFEYQVTTRELVMSTFSSWRGQANPPAPFANEHGSLLHFGARILGDGTPFSLAQLEFLGESDSFGSTNTDFSIETPDYSEFRRGIDYGADGVKGTPDDVTYTGGESGGLSVDELILTGVALVLPINPTGTTEQEQLDSILDQLNGLSPFRLTGTYTLYDSDDHTNAGVLAESRVDVRVMTPEPTTAMIVFAAASALWMTRRHGIRA